MIEHRCVFYKLHHVADKAREDLSGEAHRKSREQLLELASSIYQAETAAQAREHLNAFASAGGEQAPKAVATLQRDFEQTIAFYQLSGIARQLVRTTSLHPQCARLARNDRQTGPTVAHWTHKRKKRAHHRLGGRTATRRGALTSHKRTPRQP